MRRLAASLVVLALALGATLPAAPDDPLPSWKAGPARAQLMDFVGRVTAAGGPDYVPPAARIATFDNDGTLWSEQPMYVQLAFTLDRVKALAPMHPEWKATQPFKAALEGDLHQVAASGERGVLQLLAATHAGTTTDEFEAIVREWDTLARHPC